jgi:hypothetical protein
MQSPNREPAVTFWKWMFCISAIAFPVCTLGVLLAGFRLEMLWIPDELTGFQFRFRFWLGSLVLVTLAGLIALIVLALGRDKRKLRAVTQWGTVLLIFSTILISLVVFGFPGRLRLIRAKWSWTRMAMSQLRNLTPPPAATLWSASNGNWVVGSYLVFSNDWAAFTNHSLHESDELGEIALLRTSDGRVFRTKHHFCNDINEFMIEAEQNRKPQPRDLQDFFNLYGTNKNW